MVRTVVAAAVVAVTLSACGGDDGTGGADPAALEGVSWVLTQYLNEDGTTEIVSGVSAEFDGSTMSGVAACNSYSASYEATGSEISLGPIAATEMACPEPDATIEARYLELLAGVSSYEVEGRSMTMSDASGNPVLQFMQG